MKIKGYNEMEYIASWQEDYGNIVLRFTVTHEYRRSLDEVLTTLIEGIWLLKDYGGRALLEYLCRSIDCSNMLQWGNVKEICEEYPCIYFKISFPQEGCEIPRCMRFYEVMAEKPNKLAIKIFDSVECIRDYVNRSEERRKVAI